MLPLPGGSRSSARKTSRWSRTPDRPLMGWTARRAAVLQVLFRRPSIGKARCQPCDSTGGEHLFGSDDSIAAPIMPGGTTSFGGTAKSVVAKLQAQRPEPAVMSTASMSISRVSPKAVMARKKTPFRISLETERLGGFGFAVPPFSGTLEASVDASTSVGLLRVVRCFTSRATAARNRIILSRIKRWRPAGQFAGSLSGW